MSVCFSFGSRPQQRKTKVFLSRECAASLLNSDGLEPPMVFLMELGKEGTGVDGKRLMGPFCPRKKQGTQAHRGRSGRGWLRWGTVEPPRSHGPLPAMALLLGWGRFCFWRSWPWWTRPEPRCRLCSETWGRFGSFLPPCWFSFKYEPLGQQAPVCNKLARPLGLGKGGLRGGLAGLRLVGADRLMWSRRPPLPFSCSLSGSAGPRHIPGRAPCPPQGLLGCPAHSNGWAATEWWRLGTGTWWLQKSVGRPKSASSLGTWSGRRAAL